MSHEAVPDRVLEEQQHWVAHKLLIVGAHASHESLGEGDLLIPDQVLHVVADTALPPLPHA